MKFKLLSAIAILSAVLGFWITLSNNTIFGGLLAPFAMIIGMFVEDDSVNREAVKAVQGITVFISVVNMAICLFRIQFMK